MNADTKYSHEKSVENIFKDGFQEAAESAGHTFIAASLDGQDRVAGADYLFSDKSRYAIVEFKYRVENVRSEINKSKRHLLCQGLHFDRKALALHKDCHYAAWSNSNGGINIETNIYFNEICHMDFWGDEFNYVESPTLMTREEGNNFIDDFLEGKRGAGIKNFKAYMQWLLRLGDDSNTNGYLELLISNPYDRRSAGLAFSNVESMHYWLEENEPKLESGDKYDPPPPPGGSTPSCK